MKHDITARYIDVETALSHYEIEWRTLADETASATLFMRPSVFIAWHREIAQNVKSTVIIVEQSGKVIGILPVMRATNWRGPSMVPRIDYAPYDRALAPISRRPFPVRQLSSVVSWRASSLRPTTLCHPRDRPQVFAAIARLMAQTRQIDQIVLPIVDGDDETLWCDGFRAAGLTPYMHRLDRPLLTLETVRPFESILADSSRNFRRSVQRANKAATAAGLAFTLFEGKTAVAAQMETFAHLATQSWKSAQNDKDSGRIGMAYAGVQQAYLAQILGAGDPGLTPVMSVGYIGDRAIVASLYLCHGTTATGLLTFRSEELAAASPGLLSMIPAINRFAEQGFQRIDMNATQGWMRHLTDTRQVLSNLIGFRRTPRGILYSMIAKKRGLITPYAPIDCPEQNL